ncbi:MAG: coenzyme F420-0:L-glutamate ligase [Thaumarchaeota archaeon]|nr:coenzyme F420-0:L-glutamate ligase [Nitrososphaerota archaeon]
MITFKAVKTARKNSPFPLGELIDELIGPQLRDGDVLVLSSKFIAISEGRIVSLDTVRPGERALQLSREYDIPAELCELIIQESDQILGGVKGFLLTLRWGLFTPNAGIDKSNIEHGRVVLYPADPLMSALGIIEDVMSRRRVRIGVVVSDSRLMPTRIGTTGVALAAAGFQAIRDRRGNADLFGNPLKVTQQALGDDLCSGAQLLMGEADEATPIVVVSGLEPSLFGDYRYAMKDFSVPMDQDVYTQSLSRR